MSTYNWRHEHSADDKGTPIKSLRTLYGTEKGLTVAASIVSCTSESGFAQRLRTGSG